MTAARSAWIAAFYTLASVAIGPAIAFAGFALVTGGGDYCDAASQGNLADRASEYQLMDIVHTTGAGLMLVAGFAVLALLWLRGRRLHPIVLVLLTLAVLVMMLVYSSLGYYAIAHAPSSATCLP